jgi:hypothetical protein
LFPLRVGRVVGALEVRHAASREKELPRM